MIEYFYSENLDKTMACHIEGALWSRTNQIVHMTLQHLMLNLILMFAISSNAYEHCTNFIWYLFEQFLMISQCVF